MNGEVGLLLEHLMLFPTVTDCCLAQGSVCPQSFHLLGADYWAAIAAEKSPQLRREQHLRGSLSWLGDRPKTHQTNCDQQAVYILIKDLSRSGQLDKRQTFLIASATSSY
ncbi:hypothetical protein E1H12_04920 [Geitlerinema sp. P-1104]|uniref:hypothetical protein n=1 Tax=Geitlerinema sp. P-1104 TaxID=2546230 RepID=UPI001477313F|nr:hypothetical protein [Geitlerinema sp. P-1104]NMG57884.1 hypothetical protein [Geitlerinema sp. P-1104]